MDQLHVLSSHISLVLSTPQDLEHLEIRAKTPFTSDKRLGTVVRRSSPATGSSASPMSLSLGSPFQSTILSSRGVDLPDVRCPIAADYIFIGELCKSAAVLVFRRTHET